MKIRVVGTESVDADGQTRQSQLPLFEISRRRLKKSLITIDRSIYSALSVHEINKTSFK